MTEVLTSELISEFIVTTIALIISVILMFAICYIAATSDERKKKRLKTIQKESGHAPNNQYTDCFVELADLRFDVLNRCEFFLTQISELEARIQKKIDADIQDWHDNGVAGIDIDKEETKD